jgi:hypothetical protein
MPPKEVKVAASRKQPALLSEWSFYGAMLGAALGFGGWLGWRQYRERREQRGQFDEPLLETVAAPVKPAGWGELAEAGFDARPVASDMPVLVDVAPDSEETQVVAEAPVMPSSDVLASNAWDSPPASSGATVGEHLEVNPVMELADIMLSFGRVKGAAQALQEYIDHNPEEALQPWIRLMNVYRMAGMREEFDCLAQNLNQHFNVEVQQWDPEQAPSPPPDKPSEFIWDAEREGAAELPSISAKATTIEDMGHLRNKLIEYWGSADCLDFLHQLLRDNRGGQRSGFTLPVVEEILFLIELQETKNMMEKHAANGEKNV